MLVAWVHRWVHDPNRPAPRPPDPSSPWLPPGEAPRGHDFEARRPTPRGTAAGLQSSNDIRGRPSAELAGGFRRRCVAFSVAPKPS